MIPASTLNKRVLIVDDDPVLLTLLVATFKKAKYEVEKATNSAEALAKIMAKGARFDMIVTDLHLPDANGVNLVKMARAAGHNVPVFFISGDEMVHELDLVKHTSSGSMQKPFMPERLLLKVEIILKGLN